MASAEQCAQRLGEREKSLVRWDRLDGWIGSLRLALAAAFIATAWACAERAASPYWLAAPACLFAAVVIHHQRIRGLRLRARRAVAFYRSALDQLHGRPSEGGACGDRFGDVHHSYAADLDLFGPHGLYQRLCTARTPMGEAVLARWLLAPADLATIRERQRCVAELRNRIDFREDLAILGEPARIALQPEALLRWAGAPDELSHGGLRILAALLAAAAAAAAVLWGVRGIAFPFLALLVVESALAHALRHRVHAAVSGVERAYEDLHLLSVLLGRIESEAFSSPALQALQQRLSSGALTASRTLSKLATIVNFVEARRNPLLAPLMLPLMYNVHAALAAERWRAHHGRAVACWLEILGDIEALESLAAYSAARPDDPFPEFLDGPATFVAARLGHPLIPAATCVRNDVAIEGEIRVLLVSGSNMSGKSTLLRAVGMNAVLAMAGAPVCAARLRLTPLQVGASIRGGDSLFEGNSRFYAEIKRLRQLFNPAPLPLLFLLDELLQGTNSADRRVGAQGVVRALLARGAIGLVSTHDLSLTEGGDLGRGALRNVHFQDELTNGELRFDFKLRDGVVSKSNGVELMRAIGLDV